MAECPICGGTGFKIIERGGASGAAPCDCRVATIAKALAERSGVPKLYAECTLENFRTAHYQRDSIMFIGFAITLLAVEKYLRDFKRARHSQGDPSGLLFLGPNGSGKTHLGVAVMRTLISRGVPAVFLDCGDMLEQVKATFGTNARAQALKAAMENDLVLLDDLGAQTGSEWVKDTIGSVISHRYNEGKATLVTTNVAPEDMADRFGDRAASRLKQMCRLIQLPRSVEDFRGNKPKRRK